MGSDVVRCRPDGEVGEVGGDPELAGLSSLSRNPRRPSLNLRNPQKRLLRLCLR